MGRIYRPVLVSGNGKQEMTIAFVDSGSDETIISERLANELGIELFGKYYFLTASGEHITGRLGKVRIKDEQIDHELLVGVTDAIFRSEYSDDHGIEVIIGIDFLQDNNLKLDFSNWER